MVKTETREKKVNKLAKKIHKQRTKDEKKFAHLSKKSITKSDEFLKPIINEVAQMGTSWLVKFFQECPDNLVAEEIFKTRDVRYITKFIIENDDVLEIAGDIEIKQSALDVVLTYGKVEEIAYYLQKVSGVCLGYVINKMYSERRSIEELETLAKLLNSPTATREIERFILDMNGKTRVKDCLFSEIKPVILDKEVKSNPNNKNVSGNARLNSGLFRTPEETEEYIEDSLDRDLP